MLCTSRDICSNCSSFTTDTGILGNSFAQKRNNCWIFSCGVYFLPTLWKVVSIKVLISIGTDKQYQYQYWYQQSPSLHPGTREFKPQITKPSEKESLAAALAASLHVTILIIIICLLYRKAETVYWQKIRISSVLSRTYSVHSLSSGLVCHIDLAKRSVDKRRMHISN